MRGKRSVRALLGVLALVLVAVAAPAAIERSTHGGQSVRLDSFTATPGGDTESLNRLEAYWNDRVTYPTGKFNPAWLRKAAAEDAKIAEKTPAGRKRGSGRAKGAADDGTGGTATVAAADAGVGAASLPGDDLTASAPSSGAAFIPLGPRPLRMTGCSGCFNYTLTEGRVNAIAVDPTTTTDGSIVAYAATVGGGVWKTTNCCTASTTWNVTTDDPLISASAVDALAIDPNDHDTIYAGTGDLNYGSFSMGSQGVLKTTDGGAHWTVLGAGVFGPAYTEPAGQFPQYDAVGKVEVDPNNSSNVVAGTKKGLFFSYDGGRTGLGRARQTRSRPSARTSPASS